ncbi:helix-turn-helix domain-containing protein [Maricaulis sp.]|uniref:helix-turn-helix domain-containing protein n=1 Tax=Maricaulis sp. TaxID=1486257 RepID=UPI003A9135A9
MRAYGRLMAAVRLLDHTVGSRVALARIVRGWTCGQLAGRTGLAPRTVKGIEAGELRAGATRLFGFSVVLGVPISWFFEPRSRLRWRRQLTRQ